MPYAHPSILKRHRLHRKSHGTPRGQSTQSKFSGWLLGSALAALVSVTSVDGGEHPWNRHEFAQVHMGTRFKLVFYVADEETANRAADAAFERIKELDRCLSDYKPESEIRRLCAQFESSAEDVEPVWVSDDLWRVLIASQRLSERTDGAFDVTVGPLSRLWRRARRQKRLPRDDVLAAAKKAVGYQHVVLDEAAQTVSLGRIRMRLDVGAIAKGFAADETLKVLCRHGIQRALVDAGGDLAVGESPPDRPGWSVAVAPPAKDQQPSPLLLLSNCGVATSGDTWQFVEIDGQRYSHILDPRTGLGLTTRIAVTVVASNGMHADGLASAVSVLGPERGLPLIESTTGAEVFMMRVTGESINVVQSRQFGTLVEPAENRSEGTVDRQN